MRSATFALWSGRSSFVHRLDARIKLLLLFSFVVSLAILRSPSALQLFAYFACLIGIAWVADLPILQIVRMSLLVVPFVGFFSLIVYLTGDARRAWLILTKSYLSAFSVLVCVSATPVPRLLSAARFFGIPALLLEITHLIYRYLFVLSEQAHVMQTAFLSRGGRPGSRAVRASSGMIAVLFSRSYERASMVYQSMCGRGFCGVLPRGEFPPVRRSEWGILAGGLALVIGLHFI